MKLLELFEKQEEDITKGLASGNVVLAVGKGDDGTGLLHRLVKTPTGYTVHYFVPSKNKWFRVGGTFKRESEVKQFFATNPSGSPNVIWKDYEARH